MYRGFTEVHRDVQGIYRGAQRGEMYRADTETYSWMSLGNWLK